MGSCLKMPVGNCDQCVHFAVCKLAEKWRNIKQTDGENCGLFQSLFNFEMVQKIRIAFLSASVQKEEDACGWNIGVFCYFVHFVAICVDYRNYGQRKNNKRGDFKLCKGSGALRRDEDLESRFI